MTAVTWEVPAAHLVRSNVREPSKRMSRLDFLASWCVLPWQEGLHAAVRSAPWLWPFADGHRESAQLYWAGIEG